METKLMRMNTLLKNIIVNDGVLWIIYILLILQGNVCSMNKKTQVDKQLFQEAVKDD